MKKLAATLAFIFAITGCALVPGESAPVLEKVDRSNAVGIQLFMWNWNSIAKECTEVLGPAGIDWVEISPAQEHILGDAWWTHYQPVSYKIESRLGSEVEFQNMVDSCKSVGVDIVADAVINHMAGIEGGTGWAGTEFTKYEYPDLYSRNDFHTCKSINGEILSYQDAEQVTECELVGLSDLDTGSAKVQQKLADYMIKLLRMGVAGFRIDAAKHIAAEELEQIVKRLPENVWIIQEVIRARGEPIQPEDYLGWGDVFEFGYAYDLKKSVGSGLLAYFTQEGRRKKMVSGNQAVTFVSNHDTERNGQTLSYTQPHDFAAATALMLADPYGKPMLYSGYAFSQRDQGAAYEQDGRVQNVICPQDPSPDIASYNDSDWVCQHRWPSTLQMIQFRDATAGQPMTDFKKGSGILGFGRAAAGYIFVNQSPRDFAGEALQTSMPTGDYCDRATGGKTADGKCAGLTISVGADGSIEQATPSGTFWAIDKNSRL